MAKKYTNLEQMPTVVDGPASPQRQALDQAAKMQYTAQAGQGAGMRQSIDMAAQQRWNSGMAGAGGGMNRAMDMRANRQMAGSSGYKTGLPADAVGGVYDRQMDMGGDGARFQMDDAGVGGMKRQMAAGGTPAAAQPGAAPAGGAAPAQPQFQMMDYDKLYGQVGNARKAALDSAFLAQQQQLARQGNALAGQYNDMRGQAYTNARISALGNNEALASRGLAGNAYAGPQSGYSESSRVAQDTALGNALNAATRQEQGARDALAMQGDQARMNRDTTLANTMADLDMQKINSESEQNRYKATFDQENARQAEDTRRYNDTTAYNRSRDTLGDQYRDRRDAVSDDQFNRTIGLQMQQVQNQQTQQAIDNAMSSVGLLGYVDEQASKVLGLPVGTKSAQAAQWQAQFDQSKSGGGGGGPKNTLTDQQLIDEFVKVYGPDALSRIAAAKASAWNETVANKNTRTAINANASLMDAMRRMGGY